MHYLVLAQLLNSPFNAAQAATLPAALDGENYVPVWPKDKAKTAPAFPYRGW